MNRHTVLRLERLEKRRLLAADVAIFHEFPSNPSPGEIVSGIIRVHTGPNHETGTVKISAHLEDSLADATWTRRPGYSTTTLPKDSSQAGVGLTEVGDLNGDGVPEYLIRGKGSQAVAVGGQLEIDPAAGLGTLDVTPDFSSRQELGDLNGDGFAELLVDEGILFGAPTFPGVSVAIPSRGRLSGVGDVNGDGFDDLFSSKDGAKHIIFGHESLGTLAELSLATWIAENGVAVQGMTESASRAGDLNDDGFNDLHFWSSIGRRHDVVYGRADLGTAAIDLQTLDGTNGFSLDAHDFIAGLLPPVVLPETGVGDANGDGIDDLLLSIDGGSCFDCTGTDRAELRVRAGAIVVYGGNTHQARFVPTSDNHFTAAITVSGPGRIAYFEDANQDGVSDVIIYSGQTNFVIFGGENIKDFDFGDSFFGGFEHDGMSSYAFKSNLRAIDFNDDGVLDSIEQDGDRFSIRLGEDVDRATVAGAGNISESVTLGPQETVIYEVSGEWQDGNQPIRSTAVAESAEPDLADNVVSDREAVSLKIERIASEGLQLFVENLGPDAAQNVDFHTEFSTDVARLRWTRDTQAFPATFELRNLSGQLGSQIQGPEKIWQASHFVGGYDSEGEPVRPLLGLGLGALGDANNDDVDDFYVASYPGGPRWSTSMVFLGASGFGESGDFSSFEDLSSDHRASCTMSACEEAQIRTVVADFNGDGLLDTASADPISEATRGAVYVRFGTESGTGPTSDDELDGNNGFTVVGAGERSFLGYSVAAGDINGDGIDDLIVADGIPLEEQDREFRERESPQDELAPLFPATSNVPAVHVIFGGEDFNAVFNVNAVDGKNGFRLLGGPTAPSAFDPPASSTVFPYRFVTVASDLDLNGDGVDDIVVGDPFSGALVPKWIFEEESIPWLPPWVPVGAAYVVFGRSAKPSVAGIGADGRITDQVDLRVWERAIYSITSDDSDLESIGIRALAELNSEEYEVLGQSVLEIAPPENMLPGDIDRDGIVNFADFLILSSNFGKSEVGEQEGDLNEDGIIDFADFVILNANFGSALRD